MFNCIDCSINFPLPLQFCPVLLRRAINFPSRHFFSRYRDKNRIKTISLV